MAGKEDDDDEDTNGGYRVDSDGYAFDGGVDDPDASYGYDDDEYYEEGGTGELLDGEEEDDVDYDDEEDTSADEDEYEDARDGGDSARVYTPKANNGGDGDAAGADGAAGVDDTAGAGAAAAAAGIKLTDAQLDNMKPLERAQYELDMYVGPHATFTAGKRVAGGISVCVCVCVSTNENVAHAPVLYRQGLPPCEWHWTGCLWRCVCS